MVSSNASNLLIRLLLCLVVNDAYVRAYIRGRCAIQPLPLFIKCAPLYAASSLDRLLLASSPAHSTTVASAKGQMIEYKARPKEEKPMSVEDLEVTPAHPSKKLINFALIERALLRFKDLNGDMLVPQIFTVPKNADWAEEMWGLKLGATVIKIRDGDKYSLKKEKLLEIGFCYNPPQSIYDVFVIALLNYKKLNGDMMVPSRFIVPSDSDLWPPKTWNFKLGSTVHNIRTGGSYADKKDELLSVGFYFKPSQTTYDQAKIALLNYKKLNGNMMIPAKFVVPSDTSVWPRRTWGLKLGSTVSRIRNGRSHSDRREELLQMGFCFDASEVQYNLAVTALLKYKELNYDMMVPCSFIVPSNSSLWPPETWGLKLGQIITNIRSGVSHAEKRDDLISIGFYFKPAKSPYELIRMALLHYKELNDDMIIPPRFVVPIDSVKWPDELWGMDLGYIVKRIRGGRIHVDKKNDLLSIGLYYTAEESEYQLMKSTLIFYKQLYGNYTVPATFSVPFNSIIWPKVMWSVKLGLAVSKIRSGTLYVERREELQGIGFFTTSREGTYWIVRMALLNYKKIYGDMMVPSDLIIPHYSYLWRKETWGLQLGDAVSNIRSLRSYFDRKEDLLSIGFCYHPLKAKFELVKRTLLRFHELYGDYLVPPKFIIPYNSNLWAKEAWELKLGLMVKRIRSGKEFEDSREELLSIGFNYEVLR